MRAHQEQHSPVTEKNVIGISVSCGAAMSRTAVALRLFCRLGTSSFGRPGGRSRKAHRCSTGTLTPVRSALPISVGMAVQNRNWSIPTMAHATSTPVKGKSTATKKKAAPTPREADAIDPDMLRAVFHTLRLLDWKSGNERIGIDSRRPMPEDAPPLKKQKAPSRVQLEAVFALANRLGWMHLGAVERDLILTLRRTTYHGRNVVKEVASAIARDFPWRDGSPYNTRE